MLSFFLFLFYFISEPHLSFFPPSVVITFQTEKPVSAELFYGKEGFGGEILKGGKRGNEYRFLLRDLTPGMSYYFQLKADTFFSAQYHFTCPSPERFRFIILPPGMEKDKAISSFLVASPPDFIVANSPISQEKDGKKVLIPAFIANQLIVSHFPNAFSCQKGEFPKDSFLFSFLFHSLERDSVDFYLSPPGRDDGFDIIFLTGGNTFLRTHPVMKNPYDPSGPGLIVAGDRRYFWREGRGTIYLIIPDGRNFFSLDWLKGNQYIAFAQSGNGFVEVSKEEKRLKVMTYLLSRELGICLPVDSLIIDKAEVEELKISRVGVREVNSFSAKISWETNLPAVSLLEWGTEPKVYSFRYPPLDIAQTFRKEHSFPLFGLFPNKRYYYRVGARRGGRIIWSEENSFLTLPPRGKEVILSVNFVHPAYRTDIGAFPVSPYTYPKRDNGPQFIGLWDRALSFTISSKESLSFRASQHRIRNSQIACWSFPIPSGSYYYEIGSFSAPGFSGRSKIKIEGKTLEKGDGDTIFSGEIEVDDEEINLELGYGDSLIPGYSAIGYLIISSQPRRKREEVVFLLSANPNPFKEKTVIRYHLSAPHRVILEVYDGLGKKLFTLKNRFEGRGYQECVWDGRDINGYPMPDGIYFINIRTEEEPGWRVKVSLFRQ